LGRRLDLDWVALVSSLPPLRADVSSGSGRRRVYSSTFAAGVFRLRDFSIFYYSPLAHTAAPMMLFSMKEWSGCRSRVCNAVVLVVLY